MNKKFYGYLDNDARVELDGDIVDVGDEYHDLSELYDHRRALTVALLNHIDHEGHPTHTAFKSKLHNDGTMFDGYFIVGLFFWNRETGENETVISYHYDLKYWDDFDIRIMTRAPVYDGHNSSEVIKRLIELCK